MVKSVYIHIPFCTQICTYCDFKKMYYNEEIVDKYLIALNKEITKIYDGEQVSTIYIGGGTPTSLNMKQLKELMNIVKRFQKKSNVEFTVECNIEDINNRKMKFLYDSGVNRISVGIQTMNPKFIEFLGRQYCTDVTNKINLLKKIGFDNINVDLMYAFPNQTLDDLKNDLNKFLKLDVDHISTYSLMIEPHTILYINDVKNIDEDLDYKMYSYIRKVLQENKYFQYEISNFSKFGKESKHNLTYWYNEPYYGFGIGASGYIKGIRYQNTSNMKKYVSNNYKEETHILSKKEQIENEWILGLRKIEGISIKQFEKKYGLSPIDETVKKLLEEKKLMKNTKRIYINPKYLYTSNNILVNFIGEKNE